MSPRRKNISRALIYIPVSVFLTISFFSLPLRHKKPQSLRNEQGHEWAFAANRLDRFYKALPEELILIAEHSPEPIHSFKRASDFVSYQIPIVDSLLQIFYEKDYPEK